MAYKYRTLETRKMIQSMWESNASVSEIAATLGIDPSNISRELKRGWDGKTRLPNMRHCYDAELAHLRVREAIERRGRKQSSIFDRIIKKESNAL